MRLSKRIVFLRKKRKRKLFFTKEYLGGRYQIGEHTYGKPEIIHWGEEANLKIGKFCSISRHVVVFLGSEHRTDWVSTYPLPELWDSAKTIPGHPATKGDVIIGNDVWIGYNVTIVSGVKIGDGAVIGTGAVVAKDIPPYGVAVGNPARVVRYRFDEKTIEKLLKIKWWDWPDEKVAEHAHLICSSLVDEFIKRFG